MFADSAEAVLSFLMGDVGVLDEIVDGVSNGILIVRIDADAAVVMFDNLAPEVEIGSDDGNASHHVFEHLEDTEGAFVVAHVRRIVEDDESDVGFLIDVRYLVRRQHAEVVHLAPRGEGLQPFHIGGDEASASEEVAAGSLGEAVDDDVVHIAFVNTAGKAYDRVFFHRIVVRYFLKGRVVGDHDGVWVELFKSLENGGRDGYECVILREVSSFPSSVDGGERLLAPCREIFFGENLHGDVLVRVENDAVAFPFQFAAYGDELRIVEVIYGSVDFQCFFIDAIQTKQPLDAALWKTDASAMNTLALIIGDIGCNQKNIVVLRQRKALLVEDTHIIRWMNARNVADSLLCIIIHNSL